MDERTAKLINALGEYFGTDPETFTAYAIVIERNVDGELALSTAWQAPAPWRLSGIIDGLQDDIHRSKTIATLEEIQSS